MKYDFPFEVLHMAKLTIKLTCASFVRSSFAERKNRVAGNGPALGGVRDNLSQMYIWKRKVPSNLIFIKISNARMLLSACYELSHVISSLNSTIHSFKSIKELPI
jgi:hypothetical protein